MSRLLRFLAIALVAALLASACSGGGDESAEDETPTPAPTITNELPPTPTPVPIPDNAIRVGVLARRGDAATWAISVEHLERVARIVRLHRQGVNLEGIVLLLDARRVR